jgi:ribosomal protein L40E
MVGRIMRPEATKTDAVVLDHAGCTLMHGFVQDERIYSLCDKAKHSKDVQSKVKICKQCFCVLPLSARKCSECGFLQVGDKPTQEIPGVIDGKLVEIKPCDKLRCSSCYSANTEQVRSVKFGAFKLGIKCQQCYNFEVIKDNHKIKHANSNQMYNEYKRLCDICKKKGYKVGWAKHKFKAIFGVWPEQIP